MHNGRAGSSVVSCCAASPAFTADPTILLRWPAQSSDRLVTDASLSGRTLLAHAVVAGNVTLAKALYAAICEGEGPVPSLSMSPSACAYSVLHRDVTGRHSLDYALAARKPDLVGQLLALSFSVRHWLTSCSCLCLLTTIDNLAFLLPFD